jgi:hypothetical protein
MSVPIPERERGAAIRDAYIGVAKVGVGIDMNLAGTGRNPVC